MVSSVSNNPVYSKLLEIKSLYKERTAVSSKINEGLGDSEAYKTEELERILQKALRKNKSTYNGDAIEMLLDKVSIYRGIYTIKELIDEVLGWDPKLKKTEAIDLFEIIGLL